MYQETHLSKISEIQQPQHQQVGAFNFICLKAKFFIPSAATTTETSETKFIIGTLNLQLFSLNLATTTPTSERTFP